MAIEVTQLTDKKYTIDVGEPELSWLKQAARGMGMTKPTVLGAAFNKGLEHYFIMIREIAEHDKKKLDTGYTGEAESEGG